MKVVAQRTGLTPHVIRIWEKRYRAVEPVRTASNRRLYPEPEVERLALLRDATRAGHSIGTVARLTTSQLRALLGQPVVAGGNGDLASSSAAAARHETQCLEAVKRMDAAALEAALNAAAVELGSQGVLTKLVAPLAQSLGDLWQAGEVTAAEEHFASNIIRVFLSNHARPFAVPETAPHLIVATPAGQLHELGAVLAAAAATVHGWRVTYLGASLPAVEIASAAAKNGTKAVALSIVYPADDPALPAELITLRRLLPGRTQMVIGGRAAPAYKEAIEQIAAYIATDINDLGRLLDAIREPPAAGGALQPA